jgi:hypothetical protein
MQKRRGWMTAPKKPAATANRARQKNAAQRRLKKGGRPKAAVKSREETPKEGIRDKVAPLIHARGPSQKQEHNCTATRTFRDCVLFATAPCAAEFWRNFQMS